MIDVFIINRNLLTMPKAMVDVICKLDGVGRIIIADNGSTAKEVLDWYAADKRIVVERLNNLGHKSVWLTALPRKYNCKYYVVTDSDLDISQIPKNTLSHLQKMLIRYNLIKVGLSIKVNDIPKDSLYALMDTPNCGLIAEQKHIQAKQNQHLYYASVDTTFALYSPNVRSYTIGGARTKAPYECRHLPYYYTFENINKDVEYLNYLHTANNSSSFKYFLQQNGYL
jgi:hypothetical protein